MWEKSEIEYIGDGVFFDNLSNLVPPIDDLSNLGTNVVDCRTLERRSATKLELRYLQLYLQEECTLVGYTCHIRTLSMYSSVHGNDI